MVLLFSGALPVSAAEIEAAQEIVEVTDSAGLPGQDSEPGAFAPGQEQTDTSGGQDGEPAADTPAQEPGQPESGAAPEDEPGAAVPEQEQPATPTDAEPAAAPGQTGPALGQSGEAAEGEAALLAAMEDWPAGERGKYGGAFIKTRT